MDYRKIKENYKGLAVSQSMRDTCPVCGKKNTFSIFRSVTHLVYQCFSGSCKVHGSIRMTQPTLAQRKMYKEMQQEIQTVELPYDYTTQLPQEAQVFMLKYAISEKMLFRQDIGYSPKREMFVYPLYDHGVLKGVQYRCLYPDPEVPKYITIGEKPPYIVNHPTSDDIVITEDILSAVKVGKYANALCLLGTSLNFEHLKTLIAGKYKRIFIWLDNDTAGVKGRRKVDTELRLFGITPIILTAEGDPKETFYKEIEEKLRCI